jgi:maltose operon substrate-binding protein precursor MalM
VVATFPEQPTSVLLQVTYQRAPLHALTLSGSRITGPVPVACWANSRFASKIRVTASWRLARLGKCRPLSVGPGQLLNKTDVPFRHLAKDSGELKVHDARIRLGKRRGLTGRARARDRARLIRSVRQPQLTFGVAVMWRYAMRRARVGMSLSAGCVYVVVLLFRTVGAPVGYAQGEPQTPEAVARLLAERPTAVALPISGKVSHKITLDDEAFAMPDGQSRAVLFSLPEYRAPYVLTVKSFLYKRAMSRTEKIFVPLAVVLDAHYHITRAVSESALEATRPGMMKGPAYQVRLPIGDSQNEERFVLVFTRGTAVGDPLRVLNQRIGLRAQRSADGDIEAETKPSK